MALAAQAADREGSSEESRRTAIHRRLCARPGRRPHTSGDRRGRGRRASLRRAK
jgi:hypothetical protein